ncbi:MFS transporter [Roseiflexus castenholzii]|uniref:Major facilitator superfamily MFS_1 n=1 Tax=Roseiflexus castenholzii (strain DSM 13941 / HLO8) TaxID=383372 RepID=A7NP72_ROSCS|nr:MFS transporter [Roseiflexus castenholzii]ABU59368.1 major facilitator superfamily MFS_1 [Roseiflexus castenholzii DSM 13941]
MPVLFGWRARLNQPADIQKQNERSVLIDGIGVGIVTGVSTFLGVFLTRLGASPFLVGLITALPALTGMLLAIPAGRFLERQRNMAPWYSIPRAMVQGSFILMGLIPFFANQQATTYAIIIIWALATIPQTIVNITFAVVMGAVAGPRRRQYLMSRRWSVLGATTAITVAVIGAFLDNVAFPLNYQIVFIASFVGGVLSFLFSRRLTIPDNPPPKEEIVRQSLRAYLTEMLSVLREPTPFSRFVISAFVFNLGMMMALPLFPLYWVRQLNASDFWIGLINTTNNGVLLIAYFIWTALTRRKGNVLVLRVCTFGLVLYPLLTALTPRVEPLVFYAALAGIFGAGLNLVLFDISLATASPERTASYIALYQLTTYIATLVAPLVGTLLADLFGYTPALLTGAALRCVGAILFVWLGVGVTTERPRAVQVT